MLKFFRFRVVRRRRPARAGGRRVVRRKKNNAEYLAHKDAALKLVTNRLEYFNQFYHFKWNKVTIRNQISRWASCSRKGNLSFSYRLALLPLHLSDYIIVHELCHLGQFNHSRAFWALVEQQVPEHREIRRKLKNSS